MSPQKNCMCCVGVHLTKTIVQSVFDTLYVVLMFQPRSHSSLYLPPSLCVLVCTSPGPYYSLHVTPPLSVRYVSVCSHLFYTIQRDQYSLCVHHFNQVVDIYVSQIPFQSVSISMSLVHHTHLLVYVICLIWISIVYVSSISICQCM